MGVQLKIFLAILIMLLLSTLQSFAAEKHWYRDSGEWIANRTTRVGISTEPTSKILSDGKRYDVTLGKRIPLDSWSEESLSESWSVGIDGGMLASLERYKNGGRLTFATNTFDGFFGAWLARAVDGTIVMLRLGHLSAHLVDNSPDILRRTIYNQFWNEIIIGQEFPNPELRSNWDLYFQGSVGLNYTSAPIQKNPRASFGISAGYCLDGPDSLAVVSSADMLHAGVIGQASSYSYFLGLGYLQRPNSTHRPFRVGATALRGSDPRNQFYANKANFTALELQTEF